MCLLHLGAGDSAAAGGAGGLVVEEQPIVRVKWPGPAAAEVIRPISVEDSPRFRHGLCVHGGGGREQRAAVRSARRATHGTRSQSFCLGHSGDARRVGAPMEVDRAGHNLR